MENPAVWPAAVHVIVDAMNKHEEDMRAGICGYSVYMQIYRSLVTAGYIIEA